MTSFGEFHFLRPLWFLSLIPAILLILMWWRQRNNAGGWSKVFDAHLLSQLWLEPPGSVRRTGLLLLMPGWLLAVIALAGPVWERQSLPVYQAQIARVIVLDLSASMDAADVAPTRLARARFKVTDILARSSEGRTALVVFAGEPHVVTPLTDDTATIAAMLPALATDIVPAEGDNAAPALDLAATLLQRAGVRRGEVLLISDGMTDQAGALSAARKLRDQGHRVSVLGIGTPAGAPVPAEEGGFSGIARLDEDPLRELSRMGGGSYSQFTSDGIDLDRIMPPPQPHDLNARLEKNAGVERWVEHSVWLLPLLLPLAAAGFRRGWLGMVLAVLIIPPPADAFEWTELWLRKDQQAARALQSGQAAYAAERFQNPSWKGTALYEAGDYDEAAEAFAQTPGPEGDYNRGNALARAGKLQEAAKAYKETLEQNSDHEDAKVNLKLIEDLLRRQPSQQTDAGRENDAEDQPGKEQQQGGEESQPDTAAGNEPDMEEQAQTQHDKGETFENRQDQPSTSKQQTENESSVNNEQETTPEQDQDSRDAVLRDVQPQKDPIEKPQAASKADDAQSAKRLAPDSPFSESELALEQWLQQIPDDPGGLLRRKFMLEHLRRQQGSETK